jgi:hypothetical protein
MGSDDLIEDIFISQSLLPAQERPPLLLQGPPGSPPLDASLARRRLTRYLQIRRYLQQTRVRKCQAVSGIWDTAALTVAETVKTRCSYMNALSAFSVTAFSRCLASAYSRHSTDSTSFFPIIMKYIAVYDGVPVWIWSPFWRGCACQARALCVGCAI